MFRLIVLVPCFLQFLYFTKVKAPHVQVVIPLQVSPNKVIKVNPGGTSSQCPVCGGKVKHPAWKISRCKNCDRDYDRDRLASLAISLRGLDLCGDPFPVSGESSLPSMMDEYLYTRSMPDAPGTGRTEMAYVPNETLHNIS